MITPSSHLRRSTRRSVALLISGTLAGLIVALLAAARGTTALDNSVLITGLAFALAALTGVAKTTTA